MISYLLWHLVIPLANYLNEYYHKLYFEYSTLNYDEDDTSKRPVQRQDRKANIKIEFKIT